jgi:hypothetical protein
MGWDGMIGEDENIIPQWEEALVPATPFEAPSYPQPCCPVPGTLTKFMQQSFVLSNLKPLKGTASLT